MWSTIEWQRDGAVGTVTLHRPGRRNAMTPTMLHELHELLNPLSDDESLACLIVTGEGTWFCPGADIDNQVEQGEAAMPDAADFDVPTLLYNLPAVTIAAVNGPAAGAGMGLALACDLIYTAENAKFNTAFLDVGVAGDLGIPWQLSRLIGWGRARELSFFPQKIDGRRSAELGISSECFPDAELMREVEQRATRLAASAPLARRTLKRNYLDAEQLSFDEYLRLETSRHLPLLATEDSQEAFLAYTERRTPRYHGR